MNAFIEAVMFALFSVGLAAVITTIWIENYKRATFADTQALRTALRSTRELKDDLFRALTIATIALNNIAVQNAGQPTFEVWAKKIATDASERISKVL